MLYRQAAPVEVFGLHIQMLIDKMFITMYQHKGIGLAANQVGVLKQVIVLNVKYNPMVLINPHIRYVGDENILSEESCLSIPGFADYVERSDTIFVVSHDRYGREQNFNANGLLARVIQHETDHLHGVLINEKRID
jgi:peptide deformylase